MIRRPPKAPQAAPLPLYNGDRMSQEEFHRRYETYPEDVKFELIGGIVYMSPSLRREHGLYHVKLAVVLGFYEAFTPGIEVADNITTILGEESEPQPDLLVRILTEHGGQSHVNANDYLVDAPELVAEVAHSSRAIDLGRKKQDYFEAGVQEYLVYSVEEQELHWFHFPSRKKLKPGKDGVWKSRVFPGLWLHGPALAARDSARLLATVQAGLATPEHAAFVEKLKGCPPGPPRG